MRVCEGRLLESTIVLKDSNLYQPSSLIESLALGQIFLSFEFFSWMKMDNQGLGLLYYYFPVRMPFCIFMFQSCTHASP